ncbi:hypothetical protein [Sphingomonas sp.]|uniref:hypothetical protein n=1 Tax=Sphingomonas sp. TaxID=28214 RepID=UPI0038A1AA6F
MVQVLRFLARALLISSAAICSSALAETLPPLDTIMTAKEQQLFSDFIQDRLVKLDPDQRQDISSLDIMLAKDSEPTQFRGYLQLLRSAILLDANRGDEAKSAVDESVRLLPGYSGPLLQAFEVYAYSDRPGEAADYLLRASEIDPDAVKKIDDYDIGNLTHRLSVNRERNRLDAVAAKLLAIGWTGKQIEGRSNLAILAIKRRVADGDIAGARSLVPELVVPDQTYALLADNRYRDLWPDLEKWAGPRLERQWAIYLDEARARYSASKDIEHIIPYVEALRSAGKDELLISETLPLFSRKIDVVRDQDLISVSISLAAALSRTGQWSDLQSMFDRAEQVWPTDSQPNALNLIANQARFLLYQDRPNDAVKLMDQAIERTRKWGDVINSDATATMHLYRACALHRLGRDADAAISTAAAMTLADVDSIVSLELCLGKEDAARGILVKALAAEENRTAAIGMLQMQASPPCKSGYCADMRQRWTQLQSDPQVLSELRKYGRVLPFKVNEAAQFGGRPKEPQKPAVPVA